MAKGDIGLIMEDINGILAGTSNDGSSVYSEYEAIIHTTEEDISPYLFKLIETMSNYNKYVAEYIVVTLEILGGTFIKRIYPHRDHLEITIIRTNKYTPSVREVNRYKAVLINNNKNVYGSDYSISTEEEINQKKMITAEFQLIDRVVESIRLVHADGIYSDMTLKDIIQAEFAEKFQNVCVEGEQEEIYIDIVEPNNTNEVKQLVIPTGINIFDFPSYLQNTIYGLYNAGLGTFFQRYKKHATLFVYPLFDIKRFDQVESKMMVYFTNSVKYDYTENTYQIDGDILKVIAGSSLQSEDDAENTFINEGDGYVRVVPEQMMNRNVMVTTDSVTADNTTQMQGTKFKDRRDGADRAKFIGNETNMYKYRSYTNRQALGTYSFTWHFSKPELIYPGMPIKFIHEDSYGEIVELEGTVQLVTTIIDMVRKTRSSSVIFLAKKPVVFNTMETKE